MQKPEAQHLGGVKVQVVGAVASPLLGETAGAGGDHAQEVTGHFVEGGHRIYAQARGDKILAQRWQPGGGPVNLGDFEHHHAIEGLGGEHKAQVFGGHFDLLGTGRIQIVRHLHQLLNKAHVGAGGLGGDHSGPWSASRNRDVHIQALSRGRKLKKSAGGGCILIGNVNGHAIGEHGLQALKFDPSLPHGGLVELQLNHPPRQRRCPMQTQLHCGFHTALGLLEVLWKEEHAILPRDTIVEAHGTVTSGGLLGSGLITSRSFSFDLTS